MAGSIAADWDVIVAGAGAAGIAAAVSGARAGARTLLVERRGAPGGMLSAALVHTICGLYHLRPDTSRPLQYANPGFSSEFAEALLSSGAATQPVRMGGLDFLPHNPGGLEAVANQFLGSGKEIGVLHHSDICGAETAGGRLVSISVQTRGVLRNFHASAFVDATGDAELVAMVRAPFEIAAPEQLQRPACVCGLGGIPAELVSGDARLRIAHSIARGVAEGALPRAALGASFRAGIPGDIWMSIDLDASPYDPLDPACLARIERESRLLVASILKHLRAGVPGFGGVFLCQFPAQAGIRESRRMRGKTCLSAEDLLAGKSGADSVAFSAWPLELRETARGPKFVFPDGHRSAGIPGDALRSCAFDNLFAAGRCVSCTHEAQAAIRVAGTCLATGAAAGRMAAAFADGGAAGGFST